MAELKKVVQWIERYNSGLLFGAITGAILMLRFMEGGRLWWLPFIGTPACLGLGWHMCYRYHRAAIRYGTAVIRNDHPDSAEVVNALAD